MHPQNSPHSLLILLSSPSFLVLQGFHFHFLSVQSHSGPQRPTPLGSVPEDKAKLEAEAKSAKKKAATLKMIATKLKKKMAKEKEEKEEATKKASESSEISEPS